MRISREPSSSTSGPGNSQKPPPSGPDIAAWSRASEREKTRVGHEAIVKLDECRGAELELVRAYDRALQHATSASLSQRALELRGDHARRAELLANRIGGRGLAPRIEVTAETDEPNGDPLDEQATVAALVELEDQALFACRHGLALRDPSTREFFASVLVPAQQRTQALCRSLSGCAGRDAEDGMARLERCLREEQSAAATYQLVLESVDHVGVHNMLQQIHTSHARRADWFRDGVLAAGRQPTDRCDIWRTVAMTVQTAAGFLGVRAAFAALDAGEDRLLGFYTRGLGGRDARARKMMDEALLEQRRTHRLCRTLREFVKTPT